MTPRRILLGVTGGIAAYKALSLIRLFVKAGHSVQVIATDSALKFIGASSFEALSRNPLETSLYDGVSEVRHVALGQGADVFVVAPATANTMAKFAHGLADDLLSNTFLTTQAPIVLAPAMHTEMWQHPATQENIRRLEARGVKFVGPSSGQLTGDDSGIGRMSEPEEIFAEVQRVIDGETRQDFSGRRVLVTAGGTREALDPVRFLGNRSSGKQGVALAQRARERGAEVTLIASNLEVATPSGVHVLQAQSADELESILDKEAPLHDVVIMAAAVADYRPDTIAKNKIKKIDQGSKLSIQLIQNRDLLRGLVAKRAEGQTLVGFAAETASGEELLALGKAKLQAKGCDILVVNQVSWEHGFGNDHNSVTVMSQPGIIIGNKAGSKTETADFILDSIIDNSH